MPQDSPHRRLPARAMLGRLALAAIAVFVLLGLAPVAWAAPLDGGSPRGDTALFAPSPAATTKATATAISPTATPRQGIVAPASMARDAGSSMGSDALQATTSASMPMTGTTMAMTMPTATAPRAAFVAPSGPTATPAAALAPAPMMACVPLVPGSPFAATGFGAQWQTGEGLTANFWGPAETGGLMEPYADAPNGQRLVQYFDKGRMELDGTSVTNGLLATEMITGRIQIGADAFQPRLAAAIPLAGDPDNTGPTYAAFGSTAAGLLTPAPMQTGGSVAVRIGADGTVSPATASGAAFTLSSFDAATQHNVPQAFAAYRDRVGLASIGYARSEPFLATVKVGGVPKQVMLQVFERRVLTYTADNAPQFQVEMGNIGQHYYQWRHCSG